MAGVDRLANARQFADATSGVASALCLHGEKRLHTA
jgi:hypothetical protein